MIAGIFFIIDNNFACSSNVDMEFKADKGMVKRNNTILALECFSPTEMPQIDQIVDCVIKYNDLPPVNFKGCIRSINDKNDVLIRIASRFENSGAKQILDRIACLV